MSEREQPLAEWITQLFKAYERWKAAGNKLHFEEVLRLADQPIRNAIKGVLRARAYDASLVEDLTQETYVKLCAGDGFALVSLTNCTPLGLAAYIRVVAHNVATDYFRKALASKRPGLMNYIALEEADTQAVTSKGDEVEKRLLLGKVQACLEQASGKVRDRAIFWLYFRQGLTAKAIAALPSVAMAQKGVESLLLRLVRSIQDCVKGKRGVTASEQLSQNS